jgi:predicted methyltransferase
MLNFSSSLRFSGAMLGLCVAATVFVSTPSSAKDIYEQVVSHDNRSADDIKRDAIDRPEEVLRFAGIKPGMQVADFLAADGYYSELLSHVVGAKGHVLLLNNTGYDYFSNNAWKERIDKHRLSNVEHRTIDNDHLGLMNKSLDAVVMIKVYHDLFWTSDKDHWPKIDPATVMDQLARALKPGGILLLEDHSAKAGSGSSAAGTLHRIDEAFMRKDIESHGFAFVAKTDILRRPDDAMDQISYKPPMLGKTDRYVYLFRKKAD